MVYYMTYELEFLNLNNRLGLNIELPLLPLDTPISDLLTHLTEVIKDRGLINLPGLPPPEASSFLSPTTLLPVHLLSFVNWGRSNSSSQCPRLKPAVLRAGATVQTLLTTHKNEFVVKQAITQRRFLVINFGESF